MGFTTIGRHILDAALRSQLTPAPLNTPSLDTLAQAIGKRYGCSADSSKQGYADYMKYVPNEVGIITSEWEWNYNHCEPSQGTYNFSTIDAAYTLAVTTWGKLIRAHSLVDGGGGFLPAWLSGGSWTPSTLTTVLQNHIAAVSGRHAGNVNCTNAVNEALKPFTGSGFLTGGWQNNFWVQQLGVGSNGLPNYIGIVHNAVRTADPATKIVLNVNQIETSTANHKLQKSQVLAAITTMQAANIPIDGLGMEFHLSTTAQQDLVPQDLVNFLNAIQALGLFVDITEMDLDDSGQSANQVTRDTQDGAVYAAFFAVLAQHPAVRVIQNWQLADRDSWYRYPNFGTQRTDHLELRPCLLDGAYRVKPAYTAVQQAFLAAAAVISPTGPGVWPPPIGITTASLVFSDALGQVTIPAPYPNGCQNWTPDPESIGTPAVQYGTGQEFIWPTRRDYCVSFEFGPIPAYWQPSLDRLKLWLDEGGTVVVNTADNAGRSYTVCKRRGTKVQFRYDRQKMEYTIALTVKNMAQASMPCVYQSSYGTTVQ